MIEFDLKNRVAIVTGGAQGFGLAIVKKFIKSGAKVIIWDKDKLQIKKSLKEINSSNCFNQTVDVTKIKNINANIKIIKKKFKKIDILINNAGITGRNSKLWKYNEKEWKNVLDVNFNSVFYCCKAVVPLMLKQNYGRIVNISSIAGKEGNPNASIYSSSKAAVICLTKSLGKELANKNIAVNAVTPAAAKTRIFNQMSKKHINYMLSKIPRKRFTKVDELASLVTWLASEENSFATSSVYDLSGGRATY